MIRYNLIIGLIIIAVIGFIYYTTAQKDVTVKESKIVLEASDLIVLGAENAPVKIKIFSSLTCPHCANFHIKVVSKIKKNYVDSGKVQLIFIDFPLDQVAFNASKLLHCLDREKQIKFLDTIYKNQKQWTNGVDLNEINNNLKKIVKNLVINSYRFDK